MQWTQSKKTASWWNYSVFKILNFSGINRWCSNLFKIIWISSNHWTSDVKSRIFSCFCFFGHNSWPNQGPVEALHFTSRHLRTLKKTEGMVGKGRAVLMTNLGDIGVLNRISGCSCCPNGSSKIQERQGFEFVECVFKDRASTVVAFAFTIWIFFGAVGNDWLVCLNVVPGTMWWLILMTTFWCPEKIRWSDVFFFDLNLKMWPLRPLPAKLGSSQAAIYVEETVEAGRVWWCLARWRHSFPPISCLRHKPLALQRLPLRCGKIRQLVGWHEEYI